MSNKFKVGLPLIIIVVVLVSFRFLLVPTIRDVKTRSGELKVLEAELLVAEQKAQKLSQLKEENEKLSDEAKSIEERLYGEDKITSSVKEVTSLARSVDAVVVFSDYASEGGVSEETPPPFGSIVLKLRLRGEYKSMVDFLNALESQKIFFVENYNIKRYTYTPPTLELETEIAIRIFLKKGEKIES